MSTEQTPQEWAEAHCDWLMDVGVVQNHYGSFDVTVRVNGSYSRVDDANHAADRIREETQGMVARLRRDRGWADQPPMDPPWPLKSTPGALEPTPEVIVAQLDVYEATEVLSRCRHQLPNDTLRSLQGIWFCASAARFGEPYERFWMDDELEYAEHDTAECETENAADGESDAA